MKLQLLMAIAVALIGANAEEQGQEVEQEQEQVSTAVVYVIDQPVSVGSNQVVGEATAPGVPPAAQQVSDGDGAHTEHQYFTVWPSESAPTELPPDIRSSIDEANKQEQQQKRDLKATMTGAGAGAPALVLAGKPTGIPTGTGAGPFPAMPETVLAQLRVAFPSGIPSAMPSDIASSMMSELPSGVPTAMARQFWQQLHQMFPSSVPSRLPPLPTSMMRQQMLEGLEYAGEHSSVARQFLEENSVSMSPEVTRLMEQDKLIASKFAHGEEVPSSLINQQLAAVSKFVNEHPLPTNGLQHNDTGRPNFIHNRPPFTDASQLESWLSNHSVSDAEQIKTWIENHPRPARNASNKAATRANPKAASSKQNRVRITSRNSKMSNGWGIWTGLFGSTKNGNGHANRMTASRRSRATRGRMMRMSASARRPSVKTDSAGNPIRPSMMSDVPPPMMTDSAGNPMGPPDMMTDSAGNPMGPPPMMTDSEGNPIRPTGPPPSGPRPTGPPPSGRRPSGPLPSGPHPSGPPPSGVPRHPPSGSLSPPRSRLSKVKRDDQVVAPDAAEK